MNYFNLENSIKLLKNKKIEKIYVLVDIHGTILAPRVDKNEISNDFYDLSKEVLKFMTNNPDYYLIMSSCSYPDQIKKYLEIFELEGIIFDSVNENKEVNTDFGGHFLKVYANVILDDKAGFEPGDWYYLSSILKKFYPEYKNHPKNPEEVLQSLIADGSVEKWILKKEKKELIEKSQKERFKDKVLKDPEFLDLVIIKVLERYNSKKYKDRWYNRGFEPPENLLNFLYDYAFENGEKSFDIHGEEVINLNNKWEFSTIPGCGRYYIEIKNLQNK